MSYKEMKTIYDRNRLDFFGMAVSHLLDIGFNNAKEITDEQIATIKDQGWATAGFLQELVTTSREIANACNSPVELIQFCMAEEVFDVEFYAPKKRKITDTRMRELAETAISYLNDEFMLNEFMEDRGIEFTEEEKSYFGIYDEEDDYE